MGVDSAWEQEDAEARKMLENAAESHTSGARFVRRRHLDAASSFLRSALPYALIITVELDQVPFGIEQLGVEIAYSNTSSWLHCRMFYFFDPEGNLIEFNSHDESIQ